MIETQELFEQELRELAIANKPLKAQEEQTQAAIDEIIESQRQQLETLKANLVSIKAVRQEYEDKVTVKVSAYLDTAKDVKEEKELRKSLHHLIKVKSKTTYEYDADAARAYVIEHKMTDFFNKPTLSKSKVNAAIKKHDADWLDYKVVESRSVTIGKLGELLIIMENEDLKTKLK